MMAASSIALALGSETLEKTEVSNSDVFGGFWLKLRELTLMF